MEMESFEKTLKTSFVGAANQITQLYTNSLNFQKQAYAHGYNQATRDTLEFVLKNYSSNVRTIPTDDLLEYLKNKLEQNKTTFDHSNGPKSEVDSDIPSNESPSPSNAPFFKFDNGFTPSNARNSNGGTNVPFPFTTQTSFSQPSVFTFVPPQSTPSSHTSQQNNSFVNDNKKRGFEIPTNSMDYCYPDQFYKKSRVIG